MDCLGHLPKPQSFVKNLNPTKQILSSSCPALKNSVCCLKIYFQLLFIFFNLVTVYSYMLKPEILSVLWCMSIANFIFIAVKKKLKIYENEEHVQAPKSVWVHVGEVSVGLVQGGFFGRGVLQASPWCSCLGITAAS